MKSRIVFALVLASLLYVSPAGAATTLKPNPNGPDKFSFHGQVWTYGLNPSQKGFEIQVTNSQGVVFSVQAPRGSCVDRGRSCVFRDREAARRKDGLVLFRVLYDTGTNPDGTFGNGHGNKFWVTAYGEFTNATEALMTLRIFTDGRSPYASFTDTFKSLNNGGWWSKY
jgi:hypothetical protein